MIGVFKGFVMKLKTKVLHLFRTYCVAHREPLASKDTMKAITSMASLEKLFNTLHRWIGKSFLRNKVLYDLLIIMKIRWLKVLHVNNVR